MKKQDILDRINELIVDEKGTAVSINGMFNDSGLDSLGKTIVLITIDSEFPIFKGIPEGAEFESLDIPNLTMRELLRKCKLSITPTPMA